MTKEVNFNLREGVELAKSKWTENLSNMIHDTSNTPRYIWQAVNILKKMDSGSPQVS